MYLNEEIQNKWQPVLDHPDLDKIADSHKRSVTATILENTERAQVPNRSNSFRRSSTYLGRYRRF